MSDRNEIFDLPRSGSSKRSSRGKRSVSFYAFFFWMSMLGFLAVAFVLAVVKFSGNGTAAKKIAIRWLGGMPKGAEKIVKVPVEKIVEKPVEKVVEKVVEKIVEVQPPMPSSYVSWKKVDVAKLWNEIPVKTEVATHEGASATVERVRSEAYEIEMKVQLAVPSPNKTADGLAQVNPHLPKMLKDFDQLMQSAEVSPFYHYIYELKTTRVQQNTTRIDQLPSRHNYYDLETVLQIRHPGTQRKLLLAQADMDTVSDGSDGDRWPELDNYISMSPYYQPSTSYGWPKQTKVPNPLLDRWESKLKEYEAEFAQSGLSIERNRELRTLIDEYKPRVADLKARSYLIAEADPFIVLPLSFLGRKSENEFAPAIGDYAVVIYNDQLYPAITGDAGPTWKFGEASLRIARTINEKASPYNRPVSDLTVTYLIFPGSAEAKNSPPDLEKWYQKCSALLDEIGGIGEGFSLHRWEDLIAKRRAEKHPEAVPVGAESKPVTSPESTLKSDPESPAPSETAPSIPENPKTPAPSE